MRCGLLVVIASLLGGCAAMPPPSPWDEKGSYQNEGYKPAGKEVGGAGVAGWQGRDFCRDLANRAQKRAGVWNGMGWGFTVGAGVATAVTTVSLGTEDKPGEFRQGLNLALPLVAGLLSTGAVAFFDRGRDVDTVAAKATNGANTTEDKVAAQKCNEALAEWNSTRSESQDHAMAYLEQGMLKEKVEAAELRKKVAEAEAEAAKAETAKAEAEKAKAKAEAEATAARLEAEKAKKAEAPAEQAPPQ